MPDSLVTTKHGVTRKKQKKHRQKLIKRVQRWKILTWDFNQFLSQVKWKYSVDTEFQSNCKRHETSCIDILGHADRKTFITMIKHDNHDNQKIENEPIQLV